MRRWSSARAREPRSATESAVPVDVLTATDLVRQGRGRPEGPAPHPHPVVQRQHPADQRRSDGGPPRHAPQPGPGPHAGADQRQAPAPLLDRRLARRQRRGLRLAGPRHLRHPRHCAAAGRGAAGRRRGPVRVRRDRRRAELPAQGRPRRRLGRAQHGSLPRRRRRIDAVRRQRRPAARRHRIRQPQPGVRQREPDEPGRAAAGCGGAHRRRQHARSLRPPAGLGRPEHRRRPEGVRQLRLHAARRVAGVRPHELRQQEGHLRRLLPEPEHAPRRVQQRRRAHAAGRRRAGGERHGLGRLPDGRRHRPRAGPGRPAAGRRTTRTASRSRSSFPAASSRKRGARRPTRRSPAACAASRPAASTGT